MTNHEQIETGVIPLSEMAKIDGVDFFKGMIDGSYPAPPISSVFPFIPKEVEAGRIIFTSTPSAEFYNPIHSTRRSCIEGQNRFNLKILRQKDFHNGFVFFYPSA